MGKAIMQRHVALPEEIANKEGKGLLVSVCLLACKREMTSYIRQHPQHGLTQSAVHVVHVIDRHSLV